MGHGKRQVKKKGLIPILFHETDPFGDKLILRISLPVQRPIIARLWLFRPIPPEEVGVVIVGMHLAIEPVKQVESLRVGIP